MRWKRIRIISQLFLAFFEEGSEHHIRCIKGLPSKPKFVRILEDPIYGISLVIEHDSFDELKEGDLIPEMESPVFERISGYVDVNKQT